LKVSKLRRKFIR